MNNRHADTQNGSSPHPAAAAGHEIDRIDPPFWYAGLKDTALQLLVSGRNVGMARTVTTDRADVRIDRVVRTDNPDYLIVYLDVKGAQPGPMTLEFRFGDSSLGSSSSLVSVESLVSADLQSAAISDTILSADCKSAETVRKGDDKSAVIRCAYELRQREMNGEERVGFSCADVLYLIMPDRFARWDVDDGADEDNNGDGHGNAVAVLRHPYRIDRTRPGMRHGGNLEGIRRRLDYFCELGVTALWLTPVLENDAPDEDGHGSYHGYAVTDYYRIDPRLGTNDDYRRLVDEAHQKGLKVVMDMVFNHCGFYHPWVADMPAKDWFNAPEWLDDYAAACAVSAHPNVSALLNVSPNVSADLQSAAEIVSDMAADCKSAETGKSADTSGKSAETKASFLHPQPSSVVPPPSTFSPSTFARRSERYLQTAYRLTPAVDPYASRVDRRELVEGWFCPTMPDLNQRNPHVRRYLAQTAVWWVETVGIDGIRMDTYPYADADAMAGWAAMMENEYPNFNIVGESWVTEPAYTAAWQKGSRIAPRDSHLKTVMDFGFFERINQAKNEETEGMWDGLNRVYHNFVYDYLYPDPANVLAFIDNHDTDRFLGRTRNMLMLKQALALLLTVRRTPQIYYGTEIMMNGTAEKDDGDVRCDFPGGFPGDDRDAFTSGGRTLAEDSMFRWLSRLLHWRRGNEVIINGSQTHFIPHDGIYVLARSYRGRTVMIVLNGTSRPAVMTMKRYAEVIGMARRARDVLTGRTYDLTADLRLTPRQTLVVELEV